MNDLEAVAMPPTATQHTPESRIIWQSGEGQVANAWVFAFALLFFWLLLPVGYAFYRYLKTANHVYTLTDQRLLVKSGIIVKRIDTLELYRVMDLQVHGTLLQTAFGRGRITLHSTDASTPTLLINAVPDPADVSHLIRDAVEACRTAKGVRTFDR